jgi:hypothetical protein
MQTTTPPMYCNYPLPDVHNHCPPACLPPLYQVCLSPVVEGLTGSAGMVESLPHPGHVVESSGRVVVYSPGSEL